jgi:hypothetical protein
MSDKEEAGSSAPSCTFTFKKSLRRAQNTRPRPEEEKKLPDNDNSGKKRPIYLQITFYYLQSAI